MRRGAESGCERVDGTRDRPPGKTAQNWSRRDGIRAGSVSGPWRSAPRGGEAPVIPHAPGRSSSRCAGCPWHRSRRRRPERRMLSLGLWAGSVWSRRRRRSCGVPDLPAGMRRRRAYPQLPEVPEASAPTGCRRGGGPSAERTPASSGCGSARIFPPRAKRRSSRPWRRPGSPGCASRRCRSVAHSRVGITGPTTSPRPKHSGGW